MQKTDRIDEFVSLYTQHARRVYSFIRSLVFHQADAEDVFQEVGRVLWEKFDDYTPDTNFVSWAFTICHYKVLQFRRSQRRNAVTVLSEDVVALLDQQSLASQAKGETQQYMLSKCLQELSQHDRMLVESRYAVGESTKSVAEAAGQSIDAIYRALRRIHRLLFECVNRKSAEELLT